MADEGFHEIQLSKKQLFFVGMAAAVFAVVVFLMGVWVGRDYRRPEREMAEVPTADGASDVVPPPTQVGAKDLDYSARLQSGARNGSAGAPVDPAKPGTEAPPVRPAEPPTPVAETPVDVAAPAAAKDAPKSKSSIDSKNELTKPEKIPAKGGLSLQVGAFKDARTAGSLVTKLKAKGYAAYVFTAPSGPVRFKVRVGPFADRAEADKASAKLKKEEGFSPLVTR